MKYGVLLSLLFLTSCNWFSSDSGNSNRIYTASWTLDPHQELVACDGTIPVNYHIEQCFENGVVTDSSKCSELIKLPEQVKSPSGSKQEDIKNYINQTIGVRSYNCDEGSVAQLNLSTVNCSDSRYIKQTKDNVEDCNPYVVDVENALTSENRILYSYYTNQGDEYLSSNFTVPGFKGGKIFDEETGLFYKFDNQVHPNSIVLDSVFNAKPIKSWTKDCALFQDGTFDCNLIPITIPSKERFAVLYENATEIFQGQNRSSSGFSLSRKNNKYYFRSILDSSVIYELSVLENKNVTKVFDGFICYEEVGITTCLQAVQNNNSPQTGYLDFVHFYSGIDLIIPAFSGWFCIIDSNSFMVCKGDSSSNYLGRLYDNFPNSTNEFTSIGSFKVLEQYYDKIITTDKKMFVIKTTSVNGTDVVTVKEAFLKK